MIKGIKKIFSLAVLSFFTSHSFAQTVKEVQKENKVSPNAPKSPGDSASKNHVSNIKTSGMNKTKVAGVSDAKQPSNYKTEGAGQKTSSEAKTPSKNR